MSRPRPAERGLPEDPAVLAEFEVLLEYLKQTRGFDFTAYKRSSLMRRVLVRMQVLGVTGIGTYLDFLQEDPDEFTRLFNTILINVTSFFRDAPEWEFLRDEVLPGLIGARDGSESIRIWSAGCASGEEPYSIAMLLAELLGPDEFRDRVKIYATDADEEALEQARHAIYGPRTADDVPGALLAKYFERQDDRFIFNKEIRRSVIFGRHDLIQDAPISRVNLLICRNCLMYFNSEAQSRILARFHFALTTSGVLFLGKAETLLAQSTAFAPVDVKRRVFLRTERRPETRPVSFPAGADHDANRHLRELAIEVAPVAQLVVDREGVVVGANQRLRALFGIAPHDIGRPLQDLELSDRPFELRSDIERAYLERRTIIAQDGQWTDSSGQTVHLELSVVPLLDGGGVPTGMSLCFTDVSRAYRLQPEVPGASQELETALEELQSTNEELETTNEELQSTVEKLKTTNEELRSTNEELETMNEALESTSEEPQAINAAARDRGGDLDEVNRFLESILTSLPSAVIVVDRDLQIRKWSKRSEELWGLRSEEVLHKNFLNLDMGLPVERLHAPVRACLARGGGTDEVTLEATNRRGRSVRVRVRCTPLDAMPAQEPLGVVLLMEELNSRG